MAFELLWWTTDLDDGTYHYDFKDDDRPRGLTNRKGPTKIESRKKWVANSGRRNKGKQSGNRGLLSVELMTEIVLESRAKVEIQSGNGDSTFKCIEQDTNLAWVQSKERISSWILKIENKVFSGKKHKENRSGFCFGLENSERYF